METRSHYCQVPDLGLVTVHTVCNVTDKSNKLIEQYNDVFEGLGCMGDAYHIDIDNTIAPVQHVPRRYLWHEGASEAQISRAYQTR